MWDLLLSETVLHTILNQLKWAFYNITCIFFNEEKKEIFIYYLYLLFIII